MHWNLQEKRNDFKKSRMNHLFKEIQKWKLVRFIYKKAKK